MNWKLFFIIYTTEKKKFQTPPSIIYSYSSARNIFVPQQVVFSVCISVYFIRPAGKMVATHEATWEKCAKPQKRNNSILNITHFGFLDIFLLVWTSLFL